MKRLIVLITSVGATGAQNVIKGLRKQSQYTVTIIGCDALELNAGKHLVDRFYKIPSGGETNYTKAILEICEKEAVDLLIPIMEAELEAISLNSSAFAKYNPVTAGYNTIIACNDKLQCQELVEKLGIKCPNVYTSKNDLTFPAILKLRNGTGSQNIKIIRNSGDISSFEFESRHIIQEYIEGKEYTVDCFASKDFTFIECVPRIRLSVKGGLATKTATVEYPELINMSKLIIDAMRLNGPSNIQFIEDHKGVIYFIEINPRFGGAYIASIEAGLNAPLFLMNEIMDDPILYSGYKKLTMLRYWQEVYEYKNNVV